MGKNNNNIVDILYLVLNGFILFGWLIFLFYAFFLGGSPGPDYDRTVPLYCVALVLLGFAGGIFGVISGAKGLSKKTVDNKILPIISAVLGALGSIAFFLTELVAIGLIALFISLAIPSLYLILTKKFKKYWKKNP